MLHDEVTEPENAHAHVQLQSKVFVDHPQAGDEDVCQDSSKAASKILQTTRETTEIKGKLLASLDGIGENGMRETSWFPEDLSRTALKELAKRKA